MIEVTSEEFYNGTKNILAINRHKGISMTILYTTNDCTNPVQVFRNYNNKNRNKNMSLFPLDSILK